jgi:hypothetical protein
MPVRKLTAGTRARRQAIDIACEKKVLYVTHPGMSNDVATWNTAQQFAAFPEVELA